MAQRAGMLGYPPTLPIPVQKGLPELSSTCNSAVPTRCTRNTAKQLTRLGRGGGSTQSPMGDVRRTLAMEQHRNGTTAEPWQPPRHAAETCRCHRFPAAPCAGTGNSPRVTPLAPRATCPPAPAAGGDRGAVPVIRARTVPTRLPQHPKLTRLTATGRQKRSPHRSLSRSRCQWVGTSAQPCQWVCSLPPTAAHLRAPPEPQTSPGATAPPSPAAAAPRPPPGRCHGRRRRRRRGFRKRPPPPAHWAACRRSRVRLVGCPAHQPRHTPFGRAEVLRAPGTRVHGWGAAESDVGNGIGRGSALGPGRRARDGPGAAPPAPSAPRPLPARHCPLRPMGTGGGELGMGE